MSWKKTAAIVIPALALTLGGAGGAQANLVYNGDFELTTGVNKQFDSLTTVLGWTSTNGNNDAYNFIYAPGAADTVGATGQYGNVQLWGPGNGSNNGMPASSPVGGNFIAADGPFQNGAISQTINGLVVGDTYQVGFWWAAGQQYGFTGDTTEQWEVKFGSQSQSTVVVNNVSHGFTDWMYQTFDFQATSTSELLSFISHGSPVGVPPFTLLDGVTVNAVPEPSALLLMGGGMLGLGVAGLRCRGKSTTV
ncbi:PEP-CTERM sorting domain-containing protein [Paludisphaera borealis]|uniref:Ice-binding protein C-terminal domain-containing protein n=1 Tax=Paludisphaera borealis TaxID=1387353 RepID=A0A1U7CK77_9BACT|nr:PEP-CTERM sorting domain-containing protein [Paludisphaera borealis]APW59308.1 hypothetical protein BSF38_00725 [Paludisphaera borealis]